MALEATGNALAIARRLEPHVARVVVATRTELRAITEAKVKTDRRDARTLARLLAAGLLHGCWLPDEQTRALRRRLARRAQLVRPRTRAKNEVHAVLMRSLKGRPPMSDAFGRRGRVWLADLELPADERETVDGCLRQIERLAEVAVTSPRSGCGTKRPSRRSLRSSATSRPRVRSATYNGRSPRSPRRRSEMLSPPTDARDLPSQPKLPG